MKRAIYISSSIKKMHNLLTVPSMLSIFRVILSINFLLIQYAASFKPVKGLCASRSRIQMSSGPSVMINGLPGPMATAVAETCLDRGLNVIPLAFTGPGILQNEVIVEGKKRTQWVELVVGPGSNPKASDILAKLKEDNPNLIIVDYTHPDAVLGNVETYVKNKADFVMGTTGGSPDDINAALDKGDNIAVIAPNMAKQIVALQAALKDMATKYPRSFEGYTLTVTESHQSTKADTSGTAKAVVAHLVDLNGSNFDEAFESIVKLRNKDDSMKFGVPEEFIDAGHAFHTYTMTSADGSVSFELKHNVCGRRVYAEGTVDAVEFIAKLRKECVSKRIFNMIDILESEAMN